MDREQINETQKEELKHCKHLLLFYGKMYLLKHLCYTKTNKNNPAKIAEHIIYHKIDKINHCTHCSMYIFIYINTAVCGVKKTLSVTLRKVKQRTVIEYL